MGFCVLVVKVGVTVRVGLIYRDDCDGLVFGQTHVEEV